MASSRPSPRDFVTHLIDEEWSIVGAESHEAWRGAFELGRESASKDETGLLLFQLPGEVDDVEVLVGGEAAPLVTKWKGIQTGGYALVPTSRRYPKTHRLKDEARGHQVRWASQVRLKPGEGLQLQTTWPSDPTHLRLRLRRLVSDATIEIRDEDGQTVLFDTNSSRWRESLIELPRRERHQSLELRVPEEGLPPGEAVFAIEWIEEVREGPPRIAVNDHADVLVSGKLASVRDATERYSMTTLSPPQNFVSTGHTEIRIDSSTIELELDGEWVAPTEAGPESSVWIMAGLEPGLHTLQVRPAPAIVEVRDPVRWMQQVLAEERRLDREVRRTVEVSEHPEELAKARWDVSEDRRPGMWLCPGTSVRVPVRLQEGDRICFAWGIHQPIGKLTREMRSDFQATVTPWSDRPFDGTLRWIRADGEKEIVLDESRVKGKSWVDREIVVRDEMVGDGVLAFETESPALPSWAAAVADPRIVHRRTDEATRPRPTNVVIYTIDTTRADRLSCYGNSRNTSPYLDAMALDGFRFDACISTASWTRPSTASILTGLYPAEHGAVQLADAMSTQLVTLAEALANYGWSAWAAVSNMQASASGLNFEQGFHRFIGPLGLRSSGPESSSSKRMIDTIEPWLDKNSDEPFFLYLHSMDPHDPYEARPGFLGQFTTGYSGRLADRELSVEGTLRGLDDVTADELEFILGRYDEELRAEDEIFGRFWSWLEESGHRDDTIIIVTSDHGEEFLDHDGWFHGGQMWEEVTRVPLLVWLPPSLRARWDLKPTVIEDRVSLADIAGGILDLLELPDPEERSGWSLLETMRGNPRQSPHYAASQQASAIWTDGHKLIRQKDEQYLLFHLSDDPAEQNPIPIEGSAHYAELAQQLEQHQESLQPRSERTGPTEISPELEAALENMGYKVSDD